MLMNLPASAQDPAMPPDVARTVRALSGHWDFIGKDLAPGAKTAAKVVVTFDCAPTALDRAVACTIAGEIAGAGKIQASTVVGYSPDEHIVRWMEISSTGEYHDHRGGWKGDAIVFAPLPYTFLGEKFVEKLTLRFPSPDRFMMIAITDTKDGPDRLEGVARRRS